MISSNTASSRSVRHFFPWMIVGCGMLFYCYNYFLRVSPSVMQNELSHTFHITAYQFGTLAAFYYYAYTPMQVPAGMIYDKFGVRFVLCGACLLVVLGLGTFISSNTLTMAETGRFMIGLGSAFAYIGTLKLASIWLPTNRFATVAGLTAAVGMATGALGRKYLIQADEMIGYHQALLFVLFGGIAISVILFLLVRNRPEEGSQQQSSMQSPMNLSQLIIALKLIFANPQMWLIGIIGCLLYLPSSVFLDLWGISYLKTVYHLSADEAVSISNYTFYGWIISGPIIGMFSDKIKQRRLPLTITGFFAALLLCIVFYVPGIQTVWLNSIFFWIGFCCGAHPLCFALGKETNPIQISGTSVAVTNMLIMAGGAIFQPIVGKLLDLHTTSVMGADGIINYTPNDYTVALSVVPIGVAIGIFLSIFLKETHCESQASEEQERYFKTSQLQTEG